MDLTSFCWSPFRKVSIRKTCDFDYISEKENKILKTLVRSDLLSVYSLPSAAIIINNNICSNINFLSLEIGTIDIAIDQFPTMVLKGQVPENNFSISHGIFSVSHGKFFITRGFFFMSREIFFIFLEMILFLGKYDFFLGICFYILRSVFCFSGNSISHSDLGFEGRFENMQTKLARVLTHTDKGLRQVNLNLNIF